jgi:cell division protein FtsB
MEKFKKQNYRFWHSPLALFIFFVILVFFSYKIIDLIKKERETSHKKNLIMNEVNSLEARKDVISDKIIKLEKDGGVEEIIREKYQLVQEGEKMIIIVDEEPEEDSEAKERPSFFERLRDFFKNKK